jgi:hypothetical protein
MAEVYVVRVTVGNNVQKETKDVPSTETLRTTLENANIDYTRGITTIDGSSLKAGDMDKTYAELGITGRTFLLNVVKADNA